MGIAPFLSQTPIQEMINMTYKYCKAIVEDGHKCNKAFRVGSNFSGREHCPEHETITKSRNQYAVMEKQARLIEFVNTLVVEYPKLQQRVEDTDNRLDSVQSMLISNQFDRYKDEISEMIIDFDAKIKASRMNDDNYAKLQRQIITLNNRIIKLENQLSEQEE